MAKWRDFVRQQDLKEPDSPEDEELKTPQAIGGGKASGNQTQGNGRNVCCH